MTDDGGVLLDQYKLATEMADRLSSRRGTANSFYFTVCSAVLATSEYFSLSLVALAGLALSAAWFLQLRSYRVLAAAKWTVIAKLEADLPRQPFSDEWDLLKKDPVERTIIRRPWLTWLTKPMARYAELSVVEQVVPFVFFLLFAIGLR